MADRGKTKYSIPTACWTSDAARRSATDIVTVIKLETGFDLMDPVGSLKRMQRKAGATA